jgi:hypothetical protein
MEELLAKITAAAICFAAAFAFKLFHNVNSRPGRAENARLLHTEKQNKEDAVESIEAALRAPPLSLAWEYELFPLYMEHRESGLGRQSQLRPSLEELLATDALEEAEQAESEIPFGEIEGDSEQESSSEEETSSEEPSSEEPSSEEPSSEEPSSESSVETSSDEETPSDSDS